MKTNAAERSPAESLIEACSRASTGGSHAIHSTVLSLVAALARRVASIDAGCDAACSKIIEEVSKLRNAETACGCELWSPGIGMVRRYIGERNGPAAVAQLFILLRAAGLHAIDERFAPAQRTLVYSEGKYVELLPSSSQVAATAGAHEDGIQPRWTEFGESGRAFLVPTSEVVVDDADVDVIWPPTPGHGVPESLIADAKESISRSVKWIASISQRHAIWVTRLIRGFAVTVMPPDNELSSGSYFTRPGLVHVSFPLDPVLLAETLVHEASHQHYMLMNSVIRFVDAGANHLVYSPIKQKRRPLDRTLFAFHACFNIWDFFEDAGDRCADAERLANRRELMRGYAHAMSEEIEKLDELAPSGAALVHRLRNVLDTRASPSHV